MLVQWGGIQMMRLSQAPKRKKRKKTLRGMELVAHKQLMSTFLVASLSTEKVGAVPTSEGSQSGVGERSKKAAEKLQLLPLVRIPLSVRGCAVVPPPCSHLGGPLEQSW
jgi:hypothetical protein